MVRRIHNKVTPELDVVRHIHRDCKDCKFESHKGAETELRLHIVLSSFYINVSTQILDYLSKDIASLYSSFSQMLLVRLFS